MKISLKDKFLSTMDEHNMLRRGDSVLISLSAGIDSTVMTYLFNEIRDTFNLKLYVFHLNHKLRMREAKREAEFVKALCEELSIKAFIREYDVKRYAKESGLSVQVAARKIRYDMIYELMRKHRIDKAATAHTADDRIETLFLRLIRGTAGLNIAGIRPVRDDCIIRPLIDAKKDEIETYAKKNKIKFMTDSSNLKDDYLRNSVRLKLIPHIKKNYNQNLDGGVLNFLNVALNENDFIEKKAKVKYERVLLKKTKGSVTLSADKLNKVDNSLINRIIIVAYYEIAPYGSGISHKHIEKVRHMMSAKKPHMSYRLPGKVTVMKSYEKLKFTLSNLLTKGYEYRHGPGETTLLDEANVKVKSELINGGNILARAKRNKAKVEYLDADKLTLPLTVRSFKAGDKISPLNMKGTKKLKDIFIDKKLPASKRRTVPVIVSCNEIVLVAGICISDRFKVTEGTKRALKLTITHLDA